MKKAGVCIYVWMGRRVGGTKALRSQHACQFPQERGHRAARLGQKEPTRGRQSMGSEGSQGARSCGTMNVLVVTLSEKWSLRWPWEEGSHDLSCS